MDLDKNNVSGIVFVDSKKAFDLIDHQLLLKKLKVLGIGEDYLPLFTSFLSDRKQYVNVNSCHSKTETVRFGVPQGSILGPVLFLIFINDLPTALKNSTADIYADDTTISYSDHYNISPQAISNGIQTDINELQNWSHKNRMILNERKTKSMLIIRKRLDKKLESLDLQIELNNTAIEQVDVFSLLGLKIDMRLTFDEHVDALCNKLSQRIGILRKIKVFLPLEQRINYYNAMIKQPMMYGSIVWSACSRENVKRVLRLQKRAARVILEADMRANSVELFKELKWLPFFCDVKIQMCILVHKRLYGECPAYIKDD